MKTYNVDEFLGKINIQRVGNILKILNKNDNKVSIIKVENVECPFGIEKINYSNKSQSIFLKINIDNNINFKNFISSLEEKLFKLQCIIDKKEYILNSQIINYDKYEDKLITKIKIYKNKIVTKIYNDNDIEISIFDIKKDNFFDLELSGNIFLNDDNKFTLKWSINKICVK